MSKQTVIPFNKPKPPAMATEDEIASAFVERHRARLKYDHDAGQWFLWNGVNWSADRTGFGLFAARELARQFNPNGRASLGRASTAAGIERLAKADPDLAVTSEIWDTDPLLLGTPGGTVDLKSGLLLPADKDDFITMSAGYAPDEAEDCPRWKEFLNQSTRGDAAFAAYLQRVCGYSLSGLTNEHSLFVLIGPGGNGKSVFENILRAILGDYAAAAPFELFAATRNEQHPAGLAALKGKRLVAASEVDSGQAFAEAKIKAITGGEDISARFMRGNFFTFRPRFKIMIAANHRPALRNVDAAIRRRVKILPFTNNPAAPDKDLEKKLLDEAGGILRWAINGFGAWQREGLNPPPVIDGATSEYFAAEDTFGQWLGESCQTGAGDTKASFLFENWRTFCENRAEKPGSAKRFAGLLEAAGFQKAKQKSGIHYLGITIGQGEG